MRIISPFRDYYDNVHRGDDHPVYLRKTEVFDTSKALDEAKRTRGVRVPAVPDLRDGYPAVQVWFCGKAYAWVDVDGVHYGPDQWTGLTAQLELDAPPWKRDYSSRYYRTLATRWQAIIDTPVPIAWHQAWDSPVIARIYTGRNTYLHVNPQLNKLDFAKHVDPYTAYQELDMFLGGPLAKNNDPPQEISDEIRAAKHGFDKRSFKTDKGVKPKRKRGKKR